MAQEPTSHEEFAANWSPARDAIDHQTTKFNGHQPINQDE